MEHLTHNPIDCIVIDLLKRLYLTADIETVRISGQSTKYFREQKYQETPNV